MRDALTGAGYAPVVTNATGDLQSILRAEKPRLVLLDLMLPGADGIELLKTVPELSDVPVIFISGYGRDETVAKALNAGAVDYIVKPFSPTELVARMQVALRHHVEAEPFLLGGLAIHYERRLVSVAGRTVELTATEYELLRVLSLNAGRVVSFDTLLNRIWSGRSGANANVVRIFVKQLRDKLGDRAVDPKWIFNERGVGYGCQGPVGTEPNRRHQPSPAAWRLRVQRHESRRSELFPWHWLQDRHASRPDPAPVGAAVGNNR